MRRIQLAVTTDAAGAGTATTVEPLSGYVSEIRVPLAGTALTAGGTADFTFTRGKDGGTVLAVSNQLAPWQFQPRPAAHTTSGGTTAYSLGVGPVLDSIGVPIDDYLTVTVAQAAVSQSGTIFIHVLEGA